MFSPWIYNRVSLLLKRINDRLRRYTDAKGQTEERGPEIQRAEDLTLLSF